MNFTLSALFHMKIRNCLKYFVNDCSITMIVLTVTNSKCAWYRKGEKNQNTLSTSKKIFILFRVEECDKIIKKTDENEISCKGKTNSHSYYFY